MSDIDELACAGEHLGPRGRMEQPFLLAGSPLRLWSKFLPFYPPSPSHSPEGEVAAWSLLDQPLLLWPRWGRTVCASSLYLLQPYMPPL